MADDKPTLTRRRVLGGMATVGAAGAFGAGTWARFKDTEQKQITVSAGTLDLKVDGNNGPIPVTINDLENGEAAEDCETLTNVGNTPGGVLRFDIGDIVENENGRSEVEIEAGDDDDTGELADYLYIKGSLACASGNCFHPEQQTGYVKLSEAAAWDNLVVELENPLDEGDQCEFCFTVWFRNPDEKGGYTSDAMGDIVDFNIDITLDQYSDADYNTDAPESTRQDQDDPSK